MALDFSSPLRHCGIAGDATSKTGLAFAAAAQFT